MESRRRHYIKQVACTAVRLTTGQEDSWKVPDIFCSNQMCSRGPRIHVQEKSAERRRARTYLNLTNSAAVTEQHHVRKALVGSGRNERRTEGAWIQRGTAVVWPALTPPCRWTRVAGWLARHGPSHPLTLIFTGSPHQPTIFLFFLGLGRPSAPWMRGSTPQLNAHWVYTRSQRPRMPVPKGKKLGAHNNFTTVRTSSMIIK